MSAMRERAKEHFPMVLLTLLSIVQALALELLWSHVRESDYLFQLSWNSVVSWIQIATTFLGLVLIWVIYAANAMRFRWVPATADSVYPFVIGLIEFMIVENLGLDSAGLWLILMALTYGVMIRVSHTTMRRARQDGDNEAFFRDFDPATLRDFIPQIAAVSALVLAGLIVMLSDDRGAFSLLATLAMAGLLGWQLYSVAQFWRQSVET